MTEGSNESSLSIGPSPTLESYESGWNTTPSSEDNANGLHVWNWMGLGKGNAVRAKDKLAGGDAVTASGRL